MIYLSLFYEFVKIGLFAVGGGPATIPFLFELAAERPWFTANELTNMIAISQSTPGPIGINMATYAGFQALYSATGNVALGALGALVATLSLVLPSIVVILIIATILQRFQESRAVQAAFYGIRPAVCALILSAVINVWQVGVFADGVLLPKALIIALVAFGAMQLPRLKHLHPAVWLGAGAVLGCLLRL